MELACDDEISMTSSCEIVEALEDAAVELPADLEGDKEASPAVELLSSDMMATSHYAQVIFNDIAESYSWDLDLVCRYTLTPCIEPGHGDRVALYRLPYLQPHEYVAFMWTGAVAPGQIHCEVVIPSANLPREEDFFQFQYLRGDAAVVGASVPFQLKAPGRPDRELVAGLREEERDDMMVVNTQQTSLQEKYSNLLDYSEKLTEEMTAKQQSFVVLEEEHRSLISNRNARAAQLEADLQVLVGEKVELQAECKRTQETLGQTEQVLEATTSQLREMETLLGDRAEQISKLQASLEESYIKVAAGGAAVEERDRLAGMLDQEIQARELLLQDKQELVDRLEDNTNMLNAATRSKDLAVTEIRAQISQQDILRKELAGARQEAATAEAELVLVRQKLDKFAGMAQDSEDSFVVASVMSSLGAKLEEKEKELKKKDDELAILKDVESNMTISREIHERCLEDADKRATEFEKQNKEILAESSELKVKLERCEGERQELVARLETGARHYRKLAAEKSAVERSGEQREELLRSRVAQLERQLAGLQIEGPAVTAADLPDQDCEDQLSTGLGSFSLAGQPAGDSSLHSSGASNLDSVMIDKVIRTWQESSAGEAGQFQPSLFQPFPPDPSEVVVSQQPLPRPLLPVNIDPTATFVPELLPRQPAPYSFSSGPRSGPLECPLCGESYSADSVAALQEHVQQHMEDVVECPVCSKTFERAGSQAVFEEHVQKHFQDQEESIQIRGWDLGID